MTDNQMQQVDKKKIRIPVIIGIAGILIVAVAAVLYVTGVFGASPAERYAKIQELCIQKMIDESVSVYEDHYHSPKNNPMPNYAVELSLSDKACGFIGLTDLREAVFAGEIYYDEAKERVNLNADLLLNGTSALKGNLYGDLQSRELFVQLSDLSEKYLFLQLESYEEEQEMKELLASLQSLTPERYRELLEGLADIWLQVSPKEVSYHKNINQEIGNLSAKVGLYEASYTRLELTELSLAFLNWIRGQKEIYTWIVQASGVDEEVVAEDFADTIASLQDERDKLVYIEDSEVVAVISLGVQTDVYSVEVHYLGDDTEDTGDDSYIGGMYVKQSEVEEGFLGIGTAKGIYRFTAELRQEPDGSAKKGEISLWLDAGEYAGNQYDLEIAYDGYEKTKEGAVRYHAVLDSSSFMGMSVDLRTDVQEERLAVEAGLLMGTLQLGKLALVQTKGEAQEIELPTEAFDVMDEDELLDYLRSANLTEFLSSRLDRAEVIEVLDYFDVDTGTLKFMLDLGLLDAYLGLEEDKE